VEVALAANFLFFPQAAITVPQTRVASPAHETRHEYVPVGLRPASLRATVSCTELTTRAQSSARTLSGRRAVTASNELKGVRVRGSCRAPAACADIRFAAKAAPTTGGAPTYRGCSELVGCRAGFLAGNFDERRQELEAFTQFPPVDCRFRCAAIVGNHPADLMHFTVCPQDAAYLPDIVAAAAVWAALNFTASFYGKLDDVVGDLIHDREGLVHAGIYALKVGEQSE
jgi:hypothetical protein